MKRNRCRTSLCIDCLDRTGRMEEVLRQCTLATSTPKIRWLTVTTEEDTTHILEAEVTEIDESDVIACLRMEV